MSGAAVAGARGLSLVELLVSLVLGLLLVGAMFTVYLDRKQQYRVTEQRARMQEGARFVHALLRRELELAGFFAADPAMRLLRPPAAAPDCVNGDDWVLDPAGALDFADNASAHPPVTASGVILDCLGRDLLPETDILAIKRSAVRPRQPGEASVPGPQWFLRHHAGTGGGGWYFQRAGETLPARDMTADGPVTYWEARAAVFFIRDHMVPGDGVPTLCMERLSGGSLGPLECLVPGVEDLQLGFGVDLDGDAVPDHYDYSPGAGALSRARVARLHVLMRSGERLHGVRGPAHHQLGSKTVVDPGDGYLRQSFHTSVALHNAPWPAQ